MSTNPTISYDPDKFIARARQPELDTISKSVRQSLRGERIEWPVVNFWGVTGIGKSWLLRHVDHLYKRSHTKLDGTVVLLLEFNADESFELSTITKKLIASLEPQIPIELRNSNAEIQKGLSEAQNGNHHALIHVLMACVANKITPLILFDNTEVVSSEAWETIEKELMEPLVLNGRILFVIAGRSNIPRWRRFEVRRRVQDPQETHLKPFSKDSVEKLLHDRAYNVPVDTIFPLTAGNPRLVDELGRELLKISLGSIVDSRFIQQHNEIIIAILQQYKLDLLKNIPETLHHYLCAVMPLRAYRMEALRFMLHKVNANKYQEWANGDYLRVLRELDQTEIVWWNRERRAYTTDPVARRIINQHMQLDDQDTFIQWHHNAFALYLEWANQHKATSEEYILEAWFHLANIWQVQPNTPELEIEFKQTVEIAKLLTVDRKLVIQEQLESHDKDTEYDNELYDLLPSNWHNQAKQIWTEMLQEN